MEWETCVPASMSISLMGFPAGVHVGMPSRSIVEECMAGSFDESGNDTLTRLPGSLPGLTEGVGCWLWRVGTASEDVVRPCSCFTL